MNTRNATRILMTLAILGAWPRVQADELSPRAGWDWVIAPVRLADYDWPTKPVEVSAGFLVLRVPPPKGAGLSAIVGGKKTLMASVEYDIGWTRRSDAMEFVPVIFDDAGKRHDFNSNRGWGDKRHYTMESRVSGKDIPIDRITHIGVEMLTPDGRMDVSRMAQSEAQSAGVEVLGLPVVGQPLAFSLTTRSGHAASSEALRGKVVLIDCWATWCQPCMAKMPELKRLYDKYHDRGFEIVGINFDETLATMDNAVQNKGLMWPMVHVPDDEKVRDLWYRASSVSGLPRLLVIQRDGKLHADCAPYELTKTIDALIKANE